MSLEDKEKWLTPEEMPEEIPAEEKVRLERKEKKEEKKEIKEGNEGNEEGTISSEEESLKRRLKEREERKELLEEIQAGEEKEGKEEVSGEEKQERQEVPKEKSRPFFKLRNLLKGLFKKERREESPQEKILKQMFATKDVQERDRLLQFLFKREGNIDKQLRSIIQWFSPPLREEACRELLRRTEQLFNKPALTDEELNLMDENLRHARNWIREKDLRDKTRHFRAKLFLLQQEREKRTQEKKD